MVKQLATDLHIDSDLEVLNSLSKPRQWIPELIHISSSGLPLTPASNPLPPVPDNPPNLLGSLLSMFNQKPQQTPVQSNIFSFASIPEVVKEN